MLSSLPRPPLCLLLTHSPFSTHTHTQTHLHKQTHSHTHAKHTHTHMPTHTHTQIVKLGERSHRHWRHLLCVSPDLICSLHLHTHYHSHTHSQPHPLTETHITTK